MFTGHLDLAEAKAIAQDINQRSLSGELNPMFARMEMATLFERIRDAMSRGQQFKHVRVKVPNSDIPLSAVWLEERAPNKQDQVEVLTIWGVDHDRRLAYFKN